MAHLNCVPFLSESPWGGGWGRGQGWRNNREFVGKIDYGVRWLLWDPTVTKRFPKIFQQVVYNFIAAGYRAESLVSALPQEIVLFILNMCDWNHFGEDPEEDEEEEEEEEEERFEGPAGFRRLLEQLQSGGEAAQHALQDPSPDLMRYLYFMQQAGGGIFAQSSDDDDDDDGDEDDGNDDNDDNGEGDEDEDAAMAPIAGNVRDSDDDAVAMSEGAPSPSASAAD